jgi:hypothetical protein
MATARDLLQARLAGDREHRAGADDLDHHHDHQDRLEAFSAAKLRTDPKHALVARVRMGQILMGLAFIDNGKRIVVANSNHDNVCGAVPALAVIEVSKVLAGQDAVVGAIRSGRRHGGFPGAVREDAAGHQHQIRPGRGVNVGQLP